MNLHQQKRTNYLITFLILIGIAVFVYFFIPALQRLKSERLSVAQLQEKLKEQKQVIERFQPPTEEEKRLWNDSRQRLKAMSQPNPDTFLLNEELIKQAEYCGITDIIITPQSRGHRPVAPANGLPSGVSKNKSLLKISFHADYEPLGRFLQWFDDHTHHETILSLNIKRGFPLISVDMEVEVHQLSCDF